MFVVIVVFMGFLYLVILKFYVIYFFKVKGGYIIFIIMFFGFFGEFFGFFLSYKLICYMGDINMIFIVLVLYMFNYFVCFFVISFW